MFVKPSSTRVGQSFAPSGAIVATAAVAAGVGSCALSGCRVPEYLPGFADGSAGVYAGGGGSGAPNGGSTSGGMPSGSSSGGTFAPEDAGCSGDATSGATGSISGTVYDPAMKNPLYNVAVYVPATPLQPLPRGVPTGADACSCSALFKSQAIATTTTDVNGQFTLANVPAGTHDLVLQIGKWRRVVHGVDVAACADNAQPDKSLALPGTVPAGDTDDNMPDIAVSTGFADTLECLMLRMGVSSSEYVAGSSMAGHIHIFAGGEPGGGSGNHCIGWPQTPAYPGAPPSYTDLWATQAQLMPYDIALLSCEGCETWEANPLALEAYLNAGGRIFASHYHYAWFAGPIKSARGLMRIGAGVYAPPADWTNLGAWTPNVGGTENLIGGAVVTTLNGAIPQKAFSKGQTLQAWLGNRGALGQNGVPANELSIYTPKYNVTVSPSNVSSQPWITADALSSMKGATMYFSFDTPVNAVAAADGGSPNYCGRAVYSDLHLSGDPVTMDTPPAPGGCSNNDLSPQEKALEFMLFDLSSCVISDQTPPQ